MQRRVRTLPLLIFFLLDMVAESSSGFIDGSSTVFVCKEGCENGETFLIHFKI